MVAVLAVEIAVVSGLYDYVHGLYPRDFIGKKGSLVLKLILKQSQVSANLPVDLHPPGQPAESINSCCWIIFLIFFPVMMAPITILIFFPAMRIERRSLS